MATPRAPPAGTSRRPPPPSSMEPEPEGVIGDFLRGREIGKGSFATVYLAQHRVCSPAPVTCPCIDCSSSSEVEITARDLRLEARE